MVMSHTINLVKRIRLASWVCVICIPVLLISNKPYFGQAAFIPFYAGILLVLFVTVMIEAVVEKKVPCGGFSIKKSEKPFWYFTVLMTYTLFAIFIAYSLTKLTST